MTAESFRPKFTTSQRAQDEAREERSDYFSDNVSVTSGTRRQTNSRTVVSRGLKSSVYEDAPTMPVAYQKHTPINNSPTQTYLKDVERAPKPEPKEESKTKDRWFWQGDEPQ